MCSWHSLAISMDCGQERLAGGIGLSACDGSVHGYQTFLPRVVLSSQCFQCRALEMSSIWQHISKGKRMVSVHLVNPCFLWLFVRLCVDPDFGWNDPWNGPWPGGAGGVGRWLCAVQWGPRARPGPESQQVSSGRWIHLSHLSWLVGELFAHCFLCWVQNFQIYRLDELIQ